MQDRLLGQRFDHRHAAGVTRYQVDRQHRDAGYYECVAIRGVEGSHHFIGGIQVFSRQDIESALIREDFDRIRRTRTCYICGLPSDVGHDGDCPESIEAEAR